MPGHMWFNACIAWFDYWRTLPWWHFRERRRARRCCVYYLERWSRSLEQWFDALEEFTSNA